MRCVCLFGVVLQLLFSGATPAYLAALEDKGIFGLRKSSMSNLKGLAPPPTVPAWVRMQATKYVAQAFRLPTPPPPLTTHAHLGIAREDGVCVGVCVCGSILCAQL